MTCNGNCAKCFYGVAIPIKIRCEARKNTTCNNNCIHCYQPHKTEYEYRCTHANYQYPRHER